MMLASSTSAKDVVKAVEAEDFKKLCKALKIDKKDVKQGLQVKVKGVDVDARNADGRTALMLAAAKGNADLVRALLYCSAQINAREKDGYTALHYACEGNVDTLGAVSELIAAGADLDAKNRAGDTPLHRAAACGKGTVVTKLLESGANSGLYNGNGLTCLDIAAIANQAAVCSLLLAASPKLRRSTRALHEAVELRLLSVAKALLEGGMSANAVDPDSEAGDTLLHMAVRAGATDLVKLLIHHNANTGKLNAAKQSPADLAAGKPDILQALKDAPTVEKYVFPGGSEQDDAKTSATGDDLPLLRTKLHWSGHAPQFRSSASAEHSVLSLLDNDPKTYMEMTMSHDTENFVAFDFGREYIITGVRLCGNGSAHMVKDFTVFAAPDLEGPWAMVKTFAAEQKGPEELGELKGENQDFRGFQVRTQCIKLVMDTNYGSYSTCLNGVAFFGADGALEPWLKEFGLESLYPDFVNMKFTEVCDMWMVTDEDIKRLCKGDTRLAADLLTAINAAVDRENRLTWLDYGKPPIRQHLAGKRLPEITVLGDPGCREEVELVFYGDPDVKGETRRRLVPDPNGGPSKASFTGIVLSPPGNYIIEARSVDHQDIFVHTTEPTQILYVMKDKQDVEDTFAELDDLLKAADLL